MANIPQKSKDATEEALSAVHEALNVGPPETQTETPAEPTPESEPDALPTSRTAELFPHEASQAGWPLGEATPRLAANDDREGIGQILHALRHRPARGPYIAAGVSGFIWIAGGLAIASLYGSEIRFAAPGFGFA